MDRIAELEGEEVVVLATVGTIRPREGKRPARAMLSRRMFSDLPLVFFDDEVFTRSGIANAKSEYVRVQGTVTRYVFSSRRSRTRKNEEPRSQLQIQIRTPEQITFVDTRPSRFAGMLDEEPVPAYAPVSGAEPGPADTPVPVDEPVSGEEPLTSEQPGPADAPATPDDPVPSDEPAPVPRPPVPLPPVPHDPSQGSP
jgi:hypothetical protein